MRLLTAALAAGMAAAAAIDVDSVMARVNDIKNPTLRTMAQETMQLLASSLPTDAQQLAAIEASSTDSTWCPAKSYWQFVPAQVATFSPSSPSVSWNGDGCFQDMSVNAKWISGTEAEITITGSNPTSLLCSDSYLVTTPYGAKFAILTSLTPSHTVKWTAKSGTLEGQYAKINGLQLYVLPCGLIGSIESLLKTISLFDAPTTAELFSNNAAFLRQMNVWGPDTGVFNRTIDYTALKQYVRSGDYVAILRLDGLDPLIMWGVDGRTGHSAIAVHRDGVLHICESTDKNPFGPVYFPPPYGLICHTWDEWMPLAHAAGFAVSVLPIADQFSNGFSEDAFWAWFDRVAGQPYGYHTFLFSFLDTADPFTNLPQPLTLDFAAMVLNYLDHLLPNTTQGVSVFSTMTWGLNYRLGTNCGTLSCILDHVTSNAMSNKHPRNVAEAVSMPDNDAWTFNGNYSFVCSAFAAHGYKTALGASFPVWHGISSTEQSPRDNYEMGIYNATYFNEQNCPGGFQKGDAQSNGGYCQIMGPYDMILNGYNSVTPLYQGLNNHCGRLRLPNQQC